MVECSNNGRKLMVDWKIPAFFLIVAVAGWIWAASAKNSEVEMNTEFRRSYRPQIESNASKISTLDAILCRIERNQKEIKALINEARK